MRFNIIVGAGAVLASVSLAATVMLAGLIIGSL